MRQLKFVIERHPEGYVAYPLGVDAVIVGEVFLAETEVGILMPKFPVDAPKAKVVREREYISMERDNPDGTKTALTMPDHLHIKGSTLRTSCTQAGISREAFLTACEQA